MTVTAWGWLADATGSTKIMRMKDQELSSRRCESCEGGVATLDDQAVADMLLSIRGWTRSTSGPGIEREFGFRDYYSTLAFVNAVGWIAHRENHHPILEVHYKHCIVRYFTHAIDGLSANDFICAAKVNALCEQ